MERLSVASAFKNPPTEKYTFQNEVHFSSGQGRDDLWSVVRDNASDILNKPTI